jgi:hypothetical protein
MNEMSVLEADEPPVVMLPKKNRKAENAKQATA